MSDYNKIIAQFQKYNYSHESTLQKHEIDRVLNQITTSNTGQGEFDPAVADELW